MRQRITAHHELDADGNPAGGTTEGAGLYIRWQDGPLGRGTDRIEPNGAFVEGVVAAAIDRLAFYQLASNRWFACEENAGAIQHLEAALAVLDAGTIDRERRQVEGTHQP